MSVTLSYNINMITVEEFKSFFYRDFPYLPVYVEQDQYKEGDEVYCQDNKHFYISLCDDNTSALTNASCWQRIKDDMYNYILSEDVENSIRQAAAIIPDKETLQMPMETYRLALYYLSAHFLVDNIRTSNAGLASQINTVVTGKSVGSVSQQFGIPNQLLQDVMFAQFFTSQYGLKYVSLLMPYLRGQVCTIAGATTP